MKRVIGKWHLAVICIVVAMLSSCDMMSDDRSDCPTGLYLSFKYDYNLERADMFHAHVGAVTLYVYDLSDNLVKTYDVPESSLYLPFVGSEYQTLHITDLPAGQYRYIALCQQAPYSETQSSNRAHFVRSGTETGSSRTDLAVKLDKRVGTKETYYYVVNNDLPLDTLWHGMTEEFTEIVNDKAVYDTISLVRDTKRIGVTLRELDDPTEIDVANYGMAIVDRNSVICYDNELDESDKVVYTPFWTWYSYDRTDAYDAEGNLLDGTGKIAHAEFMTSRIIYHDDPDDDGELLIWKEEDGTVVADFNLPDLLSRLRSYGDIYRYTNQEFLDRGYDYDISIYLRGEKLSYVTIEISILGWSKRIQYEDL